MTRFAIAAALLLAAPDRNPVPSVGVDATVYASGFSTDEVEWAAQAVGLNPGTRYKLRVVVDGLIVSDSIVSGSVSSTVSGSSINGHSATHVVEALLMLADTLQILGEDSMDAACPGDHD